MMQDLKVFLVGGAVRDRLLGRPVTERDWVVVGSTPEAMQARGFRPVGRDFPVFLHPRTQEEYALARTERKQGHGYHGFVFNASPDVTLEQDLQRRDLTINAMAEDPRTGALVDPCGGQRDLDARLLRHVSEAFAEDPLRVLRVARFAARYHHLGFRVADETLALMRRLSQPRELLALTMERVWKETEKALGERDPQVYFQVLEACGALAVLFPELARLRGVPQPERHHPEVDTLAHQYLALQQAARAGTASLVRFAVLVHDLGKGLTPADQWPRHIGHEARGARCVESLCARLRVPGDYRDLGLLTAIWHTHAHRAPSLRAATLLRLFRGTDALRRPDRFHLFLQACEADARGRLGHEDDPYPQADYLRQALQVARTVPVQPLRERGLQGAALGQALDRARLRALRRFRQDAGEDADRSH